MSSIPSILVTVWSGRNAIIWRAWPWVPVAVKLLSIGVVMALGWQQEYLRNVILMVPSLFAYGWMLSHLSRLVFFGQRWPFRPSGDAVLDGVLLNDRATACPAGTLFFVLICYFLSGINAALVTLMSGVKQPMTPGQTMHEPEGMASLAALAFMAFSLWSVRFLFLYIPAAAGLSTRPIVRAKQGMLLSLQMTGVALVCILPVVPDCLVGHGCGYSQYA